ncbi:MAG: type I-E CRISPR-associated protein Cse2/CasB [Candidatus Nanopelagicales bacterium]
MSVDSPTPAEVGAEKAANSPMRVRYNALGWEVAKRADWLQRAALDGSPSAAARIARLRRGLTIAPGGSPDLWDDTMGLVPDDLVGRGNDATAAESAAHEAMVLFALHRQGKNDLPHSAGTGFGSAMRRLARTRAIPGADDSPGVRRRFDALLTASTVSEARFHLRGLVQLLRSEQIGLDYGLLAQDLAGLWSGARVIGDQVRLRWARQYRKDDRPESSSTVEPTTEKAQETS